MRGSAEPAKQLWGLGHWLNDESYGTYPDDFLSLKNPVEQSDRGIRKQRSFTGEALTDLRAAATNQFIERMQAWPTERSAIENALARSR